VDTYCDFLGISCSPVQGGQILVKIGSEIWSYRPNQFLSKILFAVTIKKIQIRCSLPDEFSISRVEQFWRLFLSSLTERLLAWRTKRLGYWLSSRMMDTDY